MSALGFPLGDPQTWVVTAIALTAAALLLRAALPRKKTGCSGCAPPRRAPPLPEEPPR